MKPAAKARKPAKRPAKKAAAAKPSRNGGEAKRSIVPETQIRLHHAQEQLRSEHERLRIAQAELRASQARFAELFDLAPVGYVTLDRSGRIREINSTGAAMLGYTPVALTHQLLRAHVAMGQRDALEAHLKACHGAGAMVQTEMLFRRRNGTTFPVQLITRVFESGDDWADLRTSMIDHTQLRAAQDALSQAKEELEQHVAERTAELQRTNDELQAEMSLRSRLESELLEVSEREKRHFGHDLHDETCQSLAGLALLARVIARELTPEVAAGTRDKITQLSDQLRALVEQTRRIARGLYPVCLHGGLPLALMELGERSRQRLPCTVTADESIVLDDSESLALYRIAQEATNNTLRHARATQMELTLRRDGPAVLLAVRDDGIGLQSDSETRSGMGLDIMRYRASSIGAHLVAERRREGGTQVICRLEESVVPRSKRGESREKNSTDVKTLT